MDTEQQLSSRMENYLKQLMETNLRWSQWLKLGEFGSAALDRESLIAFEKQSQAISSDLQRAVEHRRELLQMAAEVGLPATSLTSLARSLPVWQRRGFRNAFEAARQQLEHLRRAHISAFILLHQSLQHSRDTLRLLSTGGTTSPVYNASEPPDSGGQLLDAAL